MKAQERFYQEQILLMQEQIIQMQEITNNKDLYIQNLEGKIYLFKNKTLLIMKEDYKEFERNYEDLKVQNAKEYNELQELKAT